MEKTRLRASFTILFSLSLTLPFGCTSRSPTAPGDDDPPATNPLVERVGSGTARVTGSVRSAHSEDPLPLGGVRLTAGDALSYTNADGSFVLLGVPAGNRQLFVDASHLRTGDGHYGEFLTPLDLADNEDLNLERPIYLPFVPATSERAVAVDAATRVIGDEGVVLEIPPGGARLGGREYDGPISIRSIAPERAPLALPARFDQRLAIFVSIQPAGLEFPVPVPIAFPLVPERRPDRPATYYSLWSLTGGGEVVTNVGIGKYEGDGVGTAVGGIRAGGWHLATDLELTLREPCPADDPNRSLDCLAAATELWRGAVAANSVRVPGARTVLGRLNAAMEGRGQSPDRARDVLRVSALLFPLARDALIEYERLYRDLLDDLDELPPALAAARAACAFADTGAGGAETRQAVAERIDERLAEAVANVETFAIRFDRLSAAGRSLERFYQAYGSVTGETFEQFDHAAEEFSQAYRGFDPASSPIGIYDALVTALDDVERMAGKLVDTVSVAPKDENLGAAPALFRICSGQGGTGVGTVTDGFVPFQPGDAAGRLDARCIIVALDEPGELTSAPLAEGALIDALHPPAFLPLLARVTTDTIMLDQLAAGVLTAESPVHRWTFDAAEREGLHVSFAADGEAIAGVATEDGLVQTARVGGFDVFNLPAGPAFSLCVYATNVMDDDHVPYTFSINRDLTRFDFGAPVTGSFDVDTRGAAILFEAATGRRVFVERRCCDPLGTLFAYMMLGPDGAVVSRVDSANEELGLGNALFELPTSGLHRVLVAPFEGRFADYELVVHWVPDNPPVECALGTVCSATIDDPGETVAYTFEAGAGTAITLAGLSSAGLDRVQVSLRGPADTVIAEHAVLYFDGSSFATRMFPLPLEGVYQLAFRVPLETDPLTGSFTFRVDELEE